MKKLRGVKGRAPGEIRPKSHPLTDIILPELGMPNNRKSYLEVLWIYTHGFVAFNIRQATLTIKTFVLQDMKSNTVVARTGWDHDN